MFTAGGPLFQTFALAAVDDAVDDDGETVVLGFGALPAGLAGQDGDGVGVCDGGQRGVGAGRTKC